MTETDDPLVAAARAAYLAEEDRRAASNAIASKRQRDAIIRALETAGFKLDPDVEAYHSGNGITWSDELSFSALNVEDDANLMAVAACAKCGEGRSEIVGGLAPSREYLDLALLGRFLNDLWGGRGCEHCIDLREGEFTRNVKASEQYADGVRKWALRQLKALDHDDA